MSLLTALPPASSVLADSLADSDVGIGSPIGLLVVLLLIVAVYFLYRSMNRHLRKVPPEFNPPAERPPEANRPPEAYQPPEDESALPPVSGPASNAERPPEPRPAPPDRPNRPDDDID